MGEDVHPGVDDAEVEVRLVVGGDGQPQQTLHLCGEDELDMDISSLGLLTLTWLVAMVSAAAEVKPAITGTEMKSIKKPSLRSAANQGPAFQLWTNQS